MTQQLEFEGGNVEKAAIIASKKLNIPKEKLQYKVISYGSTGIFGLVGTKKAKIRVILPKEKSDSKQNKIAKEQEKKGRSIAKDLLNKTLSGQRQEAAPYIQDKDPNKIGLDTLQKITGLISEDAEISVENNSEQILFNIKSHEAAVLIGKRGQTLEAIQYLTEKIINKHSEERIHVQVDVEGYLKKRQENLLSLASRMAEKATRTKKPVSIGKMSAYERRIVHLSLKEDSRVRTQSKGDGYLRKLIIFPIKNSKNKKNSENLSKQT